MCWLDITFWTLPVNNSRVCLALLERASIRPCHIILWKKLLRNQLLWYHSRNSQYSSPRFLSSSVNIALGIYQHRYKRSYFNVSNKPARNKLDICHLCRNDTKDATSEIVINCRVRRHVPSFRIRFQMAFCHRTGRGLLKSSFWKMRFSNLIFKLRGEPKLESYFRGEWWVN